MKFAFLQALAILSLAGIPSAFASSAYTCAIFRYGSATYTSVTGINNKGQVVGVWSDPGQPSHAFLREADGTTVSLSGPDGSDQFTPVGINNLGQIAGPSFIRNADGSFTQIAPAVAPPGHTYDGTQITGINDQGELTGTISADFNVDTGTVLVFVRSTDGTYKIIDQAGTGSEPSLFTGPINNSDVVVEHTRYTDGYLLRPNGPKIPLLFPGLPFDSGSPGGVTITNGLNSRDVTAGSISTLFASNVAFLRTLDGHYPVIACPGALDASLSVGGLNDQNAVAGSFYLAAQDGNGSVGFIATPTGVSPHVQLSNPAWTFSSHVTGQTSGLGRVFLSNTGTADLYIPTIYVGTTGRGSDQATSFRITQSNCTSGEHFQPNIIPAGGSCFVEFTFTPQAPAWQTAALYIPDDAPDSPQSVQLGGTGIGGALQLSNTSWTFAAHNVGETSGNGVIYAYNAGPGIVTFRNSGIAEPGGPSDFNLIANTCGDSLPAFRTCALTFNFSPTTVGEQSASLNLNDTSANGPVQIPLYGYGH